MLRRSFFSVFIGFLLPVVGVAQVSVGTAPALKDKAVSYRDSHYGVRFRIPEGWSLSRKDRQVSTFRLDARSAGSRSQMRAVASLDFNPFPLSTLSGALFYYSVEKHSTDGDCERQATRFGPISKEIRDIGGMNFVHGHDEQGHFCVEARDEVYTAFRKGSCYRLDLAINTFCAETSGAQELSEEQMRDIKGRLEGILSTVTLDWEKSGRR
jgi:hypothetical protein